MPESLFNKVAFSIEHLRWLLLQERSLFSIHDPTGVRLLTMVLKFSNLNLRKFAIILRKLHSPKCDCRKETETTEHFNLVVLFL